MVIMAVIGKVGLNWIKTMHIGDTKVTTRHSSVYSVLWNGLAT